MHTTRGGRDPSRWPQSFQPSNRQTIVYSCETLMHTTRGGRDPSRRPSASHAQARQSQIGSKTKISTSRTSRQYPHTIPGMADAPQQSTCVFPVVLPRNPSCHWRLTTIRPQTTALLLSPCYCQWPQLLQFPAGAGVGLTGNHLIP